MLVNYVYFDSAKIALINGIEKLIIDNKNKKT